VTVRHRGKVVKRFTPADRVADRTYRPRLGQRGRPRGDYRVTVLAVRGDTRQRRTLTARKL
jgi:hypothetical protein